MLNNENSTENKLLGNVKRKQVEYYVSKAHEKRIATFSGLIAKLKQSMLNREEQFVYFATAKTVAFLTLLRDSGIIHNFQLVKPRKRVGPAFSGRVLVVHLKTMSKHGAAVKNLKMFTIPSRAVTMSYMQLLQKTKEAGAATVYVLNTQQGLLTHNAALHFKIGGEVVCAIK